ncbi:YXWGXW repeat-containing protein [Rhizobium sp. BK529]|uniref:YXWGXW repeat-containing protein n=1 Tax=Rhizobium sp. BK529 TaxID=2586983 RepID=UPI001619C500|nr:YXWGXW repeat-containing protein [Rhizobium sp. BK529]
MGSEDERTIFSRRFLLKALLTGITIAPLAVFLPVEAEAQNARGRPNRPPPRPRPERRPPPRRGSVWVPGYWEWSHRRRDYVWVPGRWIPARPGFRYRQPRWTNRNGSWFFIEGGWVR